MWVRGRSAGSARSRGEGARRPARPCSGDTRGACAPRSLSPPPPPTTPSPASRLRSATSAHRGTPFRPGPLHPARSPGEALASASPLRPGAACLGLRLPAGLGGVPGAREEPLPRPPARSAHLSSPFRRGCNEFQMWPAGPGARAHARGGRGRCAGVSLSAPTPPSPHVFQPPPVRTGRRVTSCGPVSSRYPSTSPGLQLGTWP